MSGEIPGDFDLRPVAERVYDRIAALFPERREINREVGVADVWKALRDVRHERVQQ